MACCRSILTYASPVWWNHSKSLIRPLTLTQNKALRWVSGAFRTTPVRALEILTSIPPLELILNHINRQTAIRFSKLPENHLILHRLDLGWLAPETEMVSPPNRVRQLVLDAYRDPTARQRDYSTLYEIAKFNSPSNERCNPLALPPWKRSHTNPGLRNRITITPYDGHTPKGIIRELHNQVTDRWKNDSDHLVCYTDASRWIDQGERLMGAGIGVAIFHKSTRIHSISKQVQNQVEPWDLELEAIKIAIRTATEITTRFEPNPPKNIHIFSDNTSAIEVALEGHASAGQKTCISIRDHVFRFIDAHPEHTVSIQYCPGHAEIRGHDLADKLAKRASSHRRNIIGLKTLTNIKRESKAKTTDEWFEIWSTREPSGFFAPADRTPPSMKPSKTLLNTARPIFPRLTQVLTGHAFIGEYYERFVPDEISSCPCGEHPQTRQHILLDCPNYADFRHLFTTERGDLLSLPEILGTPKGIDKLISFLEHTNAFTKQDNPMA
ncbi:RNA-directed DNA polymerase from transposon BS [Ceratobasidium sp. AG-Ba]|nr:RNA-directed DNA polymerase from transposon BS [Ceratobasidium sp. AG-Ba]